jgi:aldose 1-epimerase
MAVRHEIQDTERDGYEALRLVSPAGISATYVPSAGMMCASLEHHGEEVLGQREGLSAYANEGATMGIPLLHPWANRLGGPGYALDGVQVDVPADAPGVNIDGATGLPIHGLLAGCPEWQVVARHAGDAAARIEARLDVGSLEHVMELFPYPHELHLAAELRGPTLTIETRLTPTTDKPVPIAFGYHPYFRLPGVPRQSWEVRLPVVRRALLNERFLPTGRTEAVDIPPGPLGDATYDDLFPQTAARPVFTVAGGGRRIEVAFSEEYPIAVVYAPADDEVICFEPMTAPTDPFSNRDALRWAAPGSSFSASFAVTVETTE